jgi:hypothetical protein
MAGYTENEFNGLIIIEFALNFNGVISKTNKYKRV